MFCINCFHENTSVSNSRPHKKQPSIWRRRKCAACGSVFSTLERPSLAENMRVDAENGSQEPFNLGRLIISINEAFSHKPQDGKQYALWLAQTVETTISTQHPRSLTPEDIEVNTHAVLKRFDEVAAIQYAAKHRLIISASTKRRGRPSLVSHERQIGELPSR
jgi:transcriptional repressor NrdR